MPRHRRTYCAGGRLEDRLAGSAQALKQHALGTLRKRLLALPAGAPVADLHHGVLLLLMALPHRPLAVDNAPDPAVLAGQPTPAGMPVQRVHLYIARHCSRRTVCGCGASLSVRRRSQLQSFRRLLVQVGSRQPLWIGRGQTGAMRRVCSASPILCPTGAPRTRSAAGLAP